MSKTSLITVLALIASVTAEPYNIYGYRYATQIYSPSAAFTEAAAFTEPDVAAAYPATLPAAAVPVAAPAVPLAAPSLPLATAPVPFAAGFPGLYYTALSATYPAVAAFSAYNSGAYGVEEYTPVVNTASANLVYRPYPYSTASYVYGR